MRRGQVFMKEWEQRIIAEREAVHTITRCGFCDWTTEGELADTRPAYLEHRTRHHPDVKPPERRKRHRPISQISAGKNLDDNIAAARAQGASGWAGP